MVSKFFRSLIDFSLAVLSSLLLVISFPRFDLGFLAWIGLLPLLIAINGKSLKYSFLISFICGVLFFGGVFHWIFEITKYTILHEALLGLYLGPFLGFFGLTFSFITRRWGRTPALFFAPFMWVSLEYIRSNLSFLSLPWALLAHSQYQYPAIIQIASITGTYSISFLIVMVNSAIASLFLGRLKSPLHHFKIPPSPPLPKEGVTTLQKGRVTIPPFLKGDGGGFQINKVRKTLVAITALLMISPFLYGYFVTSRPINGNRINLSLVQGNIEQVKKWDRRYAREIMQIYAHLTEEASKDQPSLIIWPETATPGSINQDIRLHIEVRNIAKKAETYLLLGSAQHQKFGEKEKKKFKYLNSAFLINPQPKLVKNQRYDKIRLFPFGEYLPFKDTIPWSYLNVPNISEYVAGKEFTVFELPGFRFGVIICWENVFPELVRQFVRNGAQFIVNITNEAWFGKTAAPYQLLSMSVFRAVENRVFVVRCANTGISCIIDPYGRIVDRVKDEKGKDIFIRGVMSGWIIPLDSNTIYTRYGDWFVWVALIGTVVFLIVAWRRGMAKCKASEVSCNK
jgi:apolipoprotein N-acyltransferase